MKTNSAQNKLKAAQLTAEVLKKKIKELYNPPTDTHSQKFTERLSLQGQVQAPHREATRPAESEEKLQRRLAAFKMILDSAQQAFFAIDHGGTLGKECSAEFIRIFGREPWGMHLSEIVGQ